MREVFVVAGYTDDYESAHSLVAAFARGADAQELVQRLTLAHDRLRGRFSACHDLEGDDAALGCLERARARARAAFRKLGDDCDHAIDPDARWHVLTIPLRGAS